MQNILPTHTRAESNVQLGPFGNSVYFATVAGCAAVITTACAMIGEKIFHAAGGDEFNVPNYVDMLLPTLLGTTVVFGSLGFLAGCANCAQRAP